MVSDGRGGDDVVWEGRRVPAALFPELAQRGAAARRLAARDAWLGWDEVTRREKLPWVVNHSRFLLRPGVAVPQLASQVLAQALQRLPADWQERYGYRPVLVETLVEVGRFAGTSYRAANWQGIGVTGGRGGRIARPPRRSRASSSGCIHWPRISGRSCARPRRCRGCTRRPRNRSPGGRRRRTGPRRSSARRRWARPGCGAGCVRWRGIFMLARGVVAATLREPLQAQGGLPV